MKQQNRRQWQLAHWLSYLENQPVPNRPGLDAVHLIANKLRITHFDCPVVTVGGTNGKGSCVSLLEAIYQQAGYTVACYTSPHLVHFNERIRCQGEMVSDEVLCEAFYIIDKACDGLTLNYFQFITLAALMIFQQSQPQLVLLEVGLGGRYDPVNVVDNDIAIITSIDYDHLHVLGNTLEEIGAQKAGIMRRGKSVVLGSQHLPKVIENKAKELACQLFIHEKDFDMKVLNDQWQWQHEKGCLKNLKPLNLVHSNASCALMVTELLQHHLPMSNEPVQQAFTHFCMPGRLQTVGESILLDVAHNAQSIGQLADYLNRHPAEKNYGLVAMAKDKLSDDVLSALIPIIDEWLIAPLPHQRSAKTTMIEQVISNSPSQNIHHFDSISFAYQEVTGKLMKGERLVVFGSFYTVAEVMKLVGPR